jgi:hypothetical protein
MEFVLFVPKIIKNKKEEVGSKLPEKEVRIK